jgi:hypothetical protein
MKQRLLLAILAGLFALPCFAQRPDKGDFMRQGRLNSLSQDERARLRSAHDAALRDPNVAHSRARYEEARKEYRERLRRALLQADPSLQSILEKMRRDQADRH